MTDATTAIVATMRHPVLALDGQLRVTLANVEFCRLFRVREAETLGHSVFQLGNGQWDIPELRRLLDDVLSERNEVRDYRVEHAFETIGHRIMLVNARRLDDPPGPAAILLAIEDVTERERARRELEAQKEYRDKIVDASREALLVLDPELRVASANHTFYQNVGLDPAETEGRLVYELGEGEWNIPRLRQLLENVLPDNDAFDDYEVDHEFDRQGRRTLLLNARRVEHLQLILLAIEDLTERRQSDRNRRATEERLTAILEQLPIGVGVAEKDGRWILANPVMRRYTGTVIAARDPAVACRWHGFDADGRKLSPSEFPSTRAMRGERVPVEVDFRTDITGEWRWVRFGAAPLQSNGGVVEEVVVVAQDITELKRSERIIQESEQRFRALVTASVDAVFRMSPDWSEMRVLYGQGFIPDTQKPTTSWWDLYILPEDRPRIERAIQDAIATTGMFELEHRVKQVDGTTGWTLSRAVPILNDDGEVVEWFGAASDVTARRKGEEERERLLHELSHRVKNTLAVVQSLAHQTDGHGGSLAEFRSKFTGRLHAMARANDLLLQDAWRGADLAALVDQSVAGFRYSEAGDEVSVTGEPVTLSPKQSQSLSLVLHELGTNALKHGALSVPDGRVEVTWHLIRSAPAPRVRLQWRERSRRARGEAPRRTGFGMDLIEGAAAYELDGEADMDWGPEGLTCTVMFPVVLEGA